MPDWEFGVISRNLHLVILTIYSDYLKTLIPKSKFPYGPINQHIIISIFFFQIRKYVWAFCLQNLPQITIGYCLEDKS